MFGLPNIEQSISNFLEGNKGITSVRSIEWEKKYLWVIDFVQNGDHQPPAPFDNLFPANDVTMSFAISESNSLQLPQSAMKFPLQGGQSDISITFYDDQKRTLLTWLSDWVNLDLQNDGRFMSGMHDNHQVIKGVDSFGKARKVRPLRTLRLALLDSFKDEVLAYQFEVYPEGNIDWNGAQASDAQMYTINFVIVHKANAKDLSKFNLFSKAGVLETLGRFF